jgi:hypothetical protein
MDDIRTFLPDVAGTIQPIGGAVTRAMRAGHARASSESGW